MSLAIPTPALLRVAPEMAALAILHAALLTAEEALLAHSPALGELDAIPYGERAPPEHGERAPPEDCLVPVLVARFHELRYLLGRYQAVQTALHDPDNDFPF